MWYFIAKNVAFASPKRGFVIGQNATGVVTYNNGELPAMAQQWEDAAILNWVGSVGTTAAADEPCMRFDRHSGCVKCILK